LIVAKILVIDDDDLVRKTIARILRSKDHEVLTAEDGRSGIRVFRAEQPDLVITDLIMPEQEGIETIREICRMAPDTKIMAISGGARFGNVDFLGMAAQLGASEILSKPFDPAALLAGIGRLLGPADSNSSGTPRRIVSL
jgi:DNA-binding response OmpR family regulator